VGLGAAPEGNHQYHTREGLLPLSKSVRIRR
jgi:hypothetical protein